MPIEFLCPGCQQQLRVPETAAGKNAKCPKCSTILTVPGDTSDSPLAPPPQAGFDFSPKPLPSHAPPPQPAPFQPAPLQSSPFQPAGNPFGDEPKEGSPFGFNNAGYAVTQPLATQPQPYPQQQYPGGPNPYASPQGGYVVQQRLATPGQLGHQIVEVSAVVNHAIEIWKANLGVAVAKSLLPPLVTVPLVFAWLAAIGLTAPLDVPALSVAVMVLGYILLIIAQTWLGIGQTQMSIKLARGQHVSISELFYGGDRLLPVLGFVLIVTPFALISAFMIHIPLLVALFFFWPSYHLICDGKAGVFNSFGAARQITEGNKMTTFVLALVMYGFVMLGYMACLIGVIFAMPLISILWSTAYLMMSGQIPVPPPAQPQYPPQPYPQPAFPQQGYSQPQGYLPPPQK